MKACTKCKNTLPEDSFAWKIRDVRRQSVCRSCHSHLRKLHYEANKQKYLDKAVKWKAEEKQRFLKWLQNKSCADCGIADVRVLEFDHLSDKHYNIGARIGWMTLEKLLEEIAKCDIVCANCHKIRTSERGNHYRSQHVS